MLDAPQSTQIVIRPGFIEFTWGQPDPDLLPVEAVRRAAGAALDRYGPEALAYGAAAGAAPLLAWLRDRIQRTEAASLTLDEITGTAGNSDALDQICTLFTRPGDVVLVESPTYHLAVRIMRDHALDLAAVPTDEHGLQIEALKTTIARLRQEGRAPRLLYLIPTFHNPSGVSLSAERRRALVEVAVDEGLVIAEDDVYRELVYDGTAPASLWSLAPRGVVLRMGSFAKSLAPGLRLGWLNGGADQIRRIVDGGLRDSGGGVNHYAAMAVSLLCESGEFEKQVARLTASYRERRDALHDALVEYLPSDCAWNKPEGGFFIWVTLPEAMDATALLSYAEAAKVTYIPGVKFCLDGRGQSSLRLAFSLYKPPELAEGARRLGEAVREMTRA